MSSMFDTTCKMLRKSPTLWKHIRIALADWFLRGYEKGYEAAVRDFFGESASDKPYDESWYTTRPRLKRMRATMRRWYKT